MAKFKLGDVEAKAILASLESAKAGSRVEIRSPFPGFPSKAYAHVQEYLAPRQWTLQLIALGVAVMTVTVKIVGNELCMEELK